jgi:hypothetical protein
VHASEGEVATLAWVQVDPVEVLRQPLEIRALELVVGDALCPDFLMTNMTKTN